jgi:hypothetical protein
VWEFIIFTLPTLLCTKKKKNQSFRLKESKFMHDLDSGMWLRETV